jgi:hypothetical protein
VGHVADRLDVDEQTPGCHVRRVDLAARGWPVRLRTAAGQGFSAGFQLRLTARSARSAMLGPNLRKDLV